MILISKQYHLSLQASVPKILQISPAVSGFLFIATTQAGINEEVVHVDYNGKILWSQYYKDSIDMFGMFGQNEAIVLNVPNNKIDLINLNTHSISQYDHYYQMEDTSYMEIMIFPQTNIFAVVEKDIKKEEQRYIITYYRREKQQIQKIISIDHTESFKATDIHIRKVNGRSKIAIWSSNALKNVVAFQTIDFRQTQQKAEEKHVAINIPHTLNVTFNQENLLISILRINQIFQNKFLLVCDTNRVNQGQELQVNNNFILDAQQKTIVPAGFLIPTKHNFHFCNYYSFRSYSAFLTFSTADEQMGKSGIFYVDNKSQSIVAMAEWKATNKSKFTVNEFDSSVLIQTIHDNSNVKQVKIITNRLAEQKEIYLHFMLHIDEDFDEDLLSDAVGLLDSK